MSKYESFESAIEAIKDARAYQTRTWPSTASEDAGGRSFEEWYMLMARYLRKLDEVYAETPSFINDGDEPNIVGRQRIKKYAAIVANLAVWAVQSAMESN